MAAVSWTGTAQSIRDTWTSTIGGTWLAGDTVTITYNSKTLVITIGTLVTTAQVATTIKEAFMATYGTSLTDATATFVPNVGGRGIPEFAEYTATVSGSVVTLYANTSGVPGATFAFTKSSASGTVGGGTHAATGTGPNDVNNAANWSGGAVPSSSDTVTVDRPVSMLYNLGALSAVTLTSMTITPRFDSSAQIGLPVRNANGYEEFRATEMAIGITTLTINSGSGRIKFNFGTVQNTTNVYASGSTIETGRQAVQLRGTHASGALSLIGTSTSTTQADVGWGSNGETATLATLVQDCGTVTLGSVGTGAVTLTTVSKNGGTLNLNCAATTVTNRSGDIYHTSGAITTVTHTGGTLYDETTATYTTMNLSNSAVYNADGNVSAKTITTLNWTDNGQIVNKSGRITANGAALPTGVLTLSAS